MPRAKTSQPAETNLRSQLHAASRQALVDAAVACLLDGPESGLTYRVVAERAGASERTVYRHFAARDDLLAAAREEIRRRLGLLPTPTSEAELRTFPARLFPHFEAHRRLVEVLLLSDRGREELVAIRQERMGGVRALCRQLAPGRTDAEIDAHARRIRYILSGWTWFFYRFEYGFGPEATIAELSADLGRAMDDLLRL